MLGESFGKTFFILMISFILLMNAFIYNLIFNEEFDLKAWLLLKNLDFSKTFLLDLDRIRGGILELSTYFSLVCFLKEPLLRENLLNYTKMYYLKNLLFMSAISLFQLALYIVDKNVHITKPNLEIWGIASVVLSSSFLCLMNDANL